MQKHHFGPTTLLVQNWINFSKVIGHRLELYLCMPFHYLLLSLLRLPHWLEFCLIPRFHLKKPKATALKCVRKDSLILCASPILTVALPWSLDEDVEMYENSLTTYSSSLLSSLRFVFFEEFISNQRSFSGIQVQDEGLLWAINRFSCALISIEDSLQVGRYKWLQVSIWQERLISLARPAAV